MADVKSYGQFCALARALDEIGDRWTLLVVRELMIGPAGYSELLSRLPGVATNLLAERLARLQQRGVVEREAGSRRYALTPRGLALRPVLDELVRWGAPLMVTGPGEDVVDERWAVLAIDALLTTPRITGPATRAALHCGSTAVSVVVDRTGRRVEPGVGTETDATITGSLPELLRAAYEGVLTTGLTVSGDAAAAARVLRRPQVPPAQLPSPS